MKNLFVLLCFLFLGGAMYAQQFVTRWKMSNPGSAPGQLTFGVVTSGPATYSWQSFPGGLSGSGTFNGTNCTITGLPLTDTIELRIDTANFRQFKMAKGPDRGRLIRVVQWGDVVWANMDSAFAGCVTDFNAIDTPDLSQVESMAYMFDSTHIYWLGILDPVDFSGWNTSNVKNMEGMYHKARPRLPKMVGWDVGNVDNMSFMFFAAESDFDLQLGTWNTGKVSTMRSMFEGISDTHVYGIGNWDVSSVEDMSRMFANIYPYASINRYNTESWDVSGVKDMSYMFYWSHVTLNLSNWDVSGVVNMEGMFCMAKYPPYPLGNWNVSHVINMKKMFQGRANWEPLWYNHPIDAWDVSSVVNMDSMFYNCTFNQPLGNWTFNSQLSATDWLSYSGMDCKNYSQSLIGWSQNPLQPNGLVLGVGNRAYDAIAEPARSILQTNKSWVFSGSNQSMPCEGIGFKTLWQMDTVGSAPGQLSFALQAPDSCRYAAQSGNQVFYGHVAGPVTTITGLPVSGSVWLIIFGDSLQKVRVSQSADRKRLMQVQSWGPAWWTAFDSAFAGCVNLKVTASDTPRLERVRNMAAMFDSCVQLIGISAFNDWHTDSVSNMAKMFRNAKIFNGPLSNWSTANVTTMQQMFKGAEALNQSLASWNTGNVEDMGEMFSGATSFSQSLFNDVGKVKYMGAMFRNCPAFNQPLGHWNVSQVLNMQAMLYGAVAFNQPLQDWAFRSNVNTSNFLRNTAMSCYTYDSCLRGWAARNQPYGIYLDAQRPYGNDGWPSRDSLKNQKGWVFNDYWTNCTPLGEAEELSGGWRLGNFYPNPAHSFTSIEIQTPHSGFLHLTLCDLQGRTILHKEQHLQQGLNQINLPLGELAPGLYLAALEVEGKRMVRRLEVGH